MRGCSSREGRPLTRRFAPPAPRSGGDTGNGYGLDGAVRRAVTLPRAVAADEAENHPQTVETDHAGRAAGRRLPHLEDKETFQKVQHVSSIHRLLLQRGG